MSPCKLVVSSFILWLRNGRHGCRRCGLPVTEHVQRMQLGMTALGWIVDDVVGRFAHVAQDDEKSPSSHTLFSHSVPLPRIQLGVCHHPSPALTAGLLQTFQAPEESRRYLNSSRDVSKFGDPLPGT